MGLLCFQASITKLNFSTGLGIYERLNISKTPFLLTFFQKTLFCALAPFFHLCFCHILSLESYLFVIRWVKSCLFLTSIGLISSWDWLCVNHWIKKSFFLKDGWDWMKVFLKGRLKFKRVFLNGGPRFDRDCFKNGWLRLKRVCIRDR